jgi:hypothetical protein
LKWKAPFFPISKIPLSEVAKATVIPLDVVNERCHCGTPAFDSCYNCEGYICPAHARYFAFAFIGVSAMIFSVCDECVKDNSLARLAFIRHG